MTEERRGFCIGIIMRALLAGETLRFVLGDPKHVRVIKLDPKGIAEQEG